jgi:hypothetical protein
MGFCGKESPGGSKPPYQQGHEKQGQGFDVATVLLEANADKVYSTAVDLLKRNPNITISYREDAGRRSSLRTGKLLVGLKVARFEDHLSQLLISSAGTSGKPGGTSFVVEKVFQVCEKMGVHCTLTKE